MKKYISESTFTMLSAFLNALLAICISSDMVFPLLAVYPKEIIRHAQSCINMDVHCRAIYSRQDMEAAQMPIRS